MRKLFRNSYTLRNKQRDDIVGATIRLQPFEVVTTTVSIESVAQTTENYYLAIIIIKLLKFMNS